MEFNNPFSLLSRFGKSVWITKYPDSQMPNLDNLLANYVFSQIQTWIKAKPIVEFNNPFSLLSRFGKSVWITKYPDSQMPNLDNLLANYVFSQIQTWIKAKPIVEFNNPFSLLSRFGKSVWITKYPD